jgi:hypothetical protein
LLLTRSKDVGPVENRVESPNPVVHLR